MTKSVAIRLLIFLVILQFSITGYGQSSYTYNGKKYNPYLSRISLGFGGGLSAYQGELSGFLNPSLQRYYLNPNAGVDLSYRFNDYLSFMGEANIFFLYSDSKPEYSQYTNRIFWSVNFDYFAAAAADVIPQRRIDGRFSKWNVAVFGGIGQVNFFPKSNDGGDNLAKVIIDNPYDTEPATGNYSSLSLMYPVGVIGKYYLNKNQFFSIQATYHFTKTYFMDALRDLSAGGFDKYLTLQFKYTIIFDTIKPGFFDYKKYMKNNRKTMNRHTQ